MSKIWDSASEAWEGTHSALVRLVDQDGKRTGEELTLLLQSRLVGARIGKASARLRWFLRGLGGGNHDREIRGEAADADREEALVEAALAKSQRVLRVPHRANGKPLVRASNEGPCVVRAVEGS